MNIFNFISATIAAIFDGLQL